jgi:hypothetical protein
MIIGLCGREGAGKSSAAQALTGEDILNVKYTRVNTWEYIAEHIDSQILDIVKPKICELIQHIEPEVVVPDSLYLGSEIMIAALLKLICTALTGISYNVMCGLTPDDRIRRELSIPGIGFSSREILQKIGTIFREVDPCIWIRIAITRAQALISSGHKLVIISDVRYQNEIECVKKNGGHIIYICRNLSDLQVTDADRATHPSRWEFLDVRGNDQIIVNNTSIVDMVTQIQEYIQKKTINVL